MHNDFYLKFNIGNNADSGYFLLLVTSVQMNNTHAIFFAFFSNWNYFVTPLIKTLEGYHWSQQAVKSEVGGPGSNDS